MKTKCFIYKEQTHTPAKEPWNRSSKPTRKLIEISRKHVIYQIVSESLIRTAKCFDLETETRHVDTFFEFRFISTTYWIYHHILISGMGRFGIFEWQIP